MASIGEIYSNEPPTIDPDQTEGPELEFYFGVFFDGTSNNMIQKKAAKAFKENVIKRPDSSTLGYKWEFVVKYNTEETDKNTLANVANPLTGGGNKSGESLSCIKYSNVAILHSQYVGMSKRQVDQNKSKNKEIRIFNIYIEGPGTEEIWSGNFAEKTLTAAGSVSGRGHTGIVNLVSKAVKMVSIITSGYAVERIKKAKIHFDVFGFSRGAACARLFAHLVSRNKNEKPLPCEDKFKNSYASALFKGNRLSFLSEFKERKVDFLGIFDTVCATGLLSVDSYLENTNEFGLYSPSNENVTNVLHIIALDEFRAHFGVTDIGSACSSNKTELYIPGCHSDIGGGYVDGIDAFELNLYNGPLFSTNRISIFLDKMVGGQIGVNTDNLGRDSLLNLGWISHTNEDMIYPYDWRFKRKSNIDGKYHYIDWVKETIYNIEVKRFVLGGYSNIPLKIMKDRAEHDIQKEGREMFVNPGNLPPEYNQLFILDSDNTLSDIVNDLLALSKASGRIVYIPEGKLHSEKYRRLRKFLHFTSKEALGFTPSYNRNTICRYVYSGDKNGKKRYYMNEIIV